MNQSLQSYTPVAHPLNYDSLATAEGVENESGNTFYGALAFTRVSVHSHNPADQWFNQLDTVSYAYGPMVPGDATKPFLTRWTAWQSTSGIRIDKGGAVVPPAPTRGSASSLFPTSRTTKVTHAFNAAGLLAMAVEKETPGFIELRRHYEDGGIVEIIKTSFAGSSPLLFYTGLLEHGEPGVGGLVCYYLRKETPNVIYGRFEADNFNVERAVMPDMRVAAARLISTRAVGNRQVLLLSDVSGRDVTLTSPEYNLAFRAKSTVTVSLLGGAISELGINAAATSSKSKLDVSFLGGSIFDAMAETKPLTIHNATVDVGLDSGEILEA